MLKGKVCKKCFDWKPLDDFNRNIKGRLGRNTYCRDCTKKKDAAYLSNPEIRRHRIENAINYAVRKVEAVGANASYNEIHLYVNQKFGKTGVCEDCTVERGTRKGGTHWASIGHTYNPFNQDEWRELCPKCHKAFDQVAA